MNARRAMVAQALACAAFLLSVEGVAGSTCTSEALALGKYSSSLAPYLDEDSGADFTKTCDASAMTAPTVIAMFARRSVPCEDRRCGHVRVGSRLFKVERPFSEIGAAVIELQPAARPVEQLQTLRDSRDVLHFEANCRPAPAPVRPKPPDPVIQYSKRWGMDDAGVPSSPISGLGKPLRIAVLDSGIDCRHPDLHARIVGRHKIVPPRRCALDAGASYYFSDLPPDNCDDNSDPLCKSHGTEVAGVIAAKGRVRGVDPDASLVSMRILGPQSAPDVAPVGDIVRALLESAHWKARILNLSVEWYEEHPSIAAALDRVTEGGKRLVVVAAGVHAGTGASSFPGIYSYCNPAAIGVAAFGQKVPSTGKYAAESYSNPDPRLLFAPGLQIYTTFSKTNVGDYSNAYTWAHGASLAAPHVAGSASLVWRMQEFTKCPASAIRELLYCSARRSEIERWGYRQRLQLDCLLGDRNNATCDVARECIEHVKKTSCR